MADRTAAAPLGTAAPVAAGALLLDPATLAGHARTALAAADVATVIGTEPFAVDIRDIDGEPALTAVPDLVREQLERGRRTTLVVSPRLDDGVWLVLDGRWRERDGVVVLAVEAVWVGCPHGHGHARPLSLTAYATAVPDLLRASMPRLVEHANREHAPELRELAGRRLGCSPDAVAGASLFGLDAAGVGLRVVDLAGSTDLRLPFARPATSRCDLLALLRAVLTA